MTEVPGQGGGQGSSAAGCIKFVAIGCLAMAILGMLAFGGCFYGIVQVIKSSEAYQMAEQLARTHPEVQERIGAVESFGFMPSGSVSTENSGGEAELSVTVYGSEGSGTLYFEAEKEAGVWKTTSAVFAVEGGERVTLVPGDG